MKKNLFLFLTLCLGLLASCKEPDTPKPDGPKDAPVLEDVSIYEKSVEEILEILAPHFDAMKKYILTNWGKAVKQLEKTQETLKIEKPIKIILIYEDFFNCICLDKLFELDKTLFNDKYYWLMSIKDFEKLMYTYKTSPEIFFKVVSEKIKAEETHSNEGRDISKFLSDNGITENDYLSNFGISEEFEKIEDYLKQNLS